MLRGYRSYPNLMGERSPWWTPYARGAFIGLTLSHTLNDVAKAVLEGVALNLGLILSVFKENKVFISEPVILVGGGAESELWPQIISDVLGLKIGIPKYTEESTGLGAAMVALHALKHGHVAEIK